MAALAASIDSWRRHEPARGEPLDLTPEDVEKLRALGYVGG